MGIHLNPLKCCTDRAARLLAVLLIAGLAGCATKAPKPEAAPATDAPVVDAEAAVAADAPVAELPAAEPDIDAGQLSSPTTEPAPSVDDKPVESSKRVESTDPCDQANSSAEMIDVSRRNLEETVCSAALWFDGLFGEQRNIEAARGVYGKVETSIAYSQFYDFNTRTRFQVRADLPNMQHRVSAFIGRDNDDEFVRDRSEGFGLRKQFPTVDDRDEWLAGLGYSLPGSKRFQSDFRVGVRGLSSPRVFVQSRLRYNAYADSNDTFDLRLTPFWNSRDGFGVTPGADYSHVLSPTLLARISLTGTRTQNSEGLDWRHAYILYQGLKKGRGLAYEAFIRGLTGADVGLQEYGLQTVYRQPLLRRRLFGEFLAGYSWPKEDPEVPRTGSYLVGFGLEMPFGKDFHEDK